MAVAHDPCPAPTLDNVTPQLRRAWHAVAHSHELGDRPLGIELLGDRWVIIRSGDGTPAAFVDRCPHRLAPLSAGCVVGGELQCGYHGWRFRSDGSCSAIPALGEGATLPPKAHLVAAHAVAESSGLIWMAPEEPVGHVPVIAEWGSDGFRCGFATTTRTSVSAAQLIDNFMDAAHFPFVHADTFGVSEAATARDDGIDRVGSTVRSRFATPYREGDVVVDHEVTKIGHASFIAEVNLRFPASGGEFLILYACQPESATSTRVFKAMARNDLADQAAWDRLVAEEDVILAEDLAILEQYRDPTVHLDPTVEVHTRADRLSLAWRRLMSETFFPAG